MHASKDISSHLFSLGKLIIIFIYLVTRLTALNSIPSTLNPDEASIAYNAFLLLQTNKDEWGVKWPLVLEAFGDQKVIGYTALVVPSLAIFGINDAAVRIPVLIAGLGILLLTDLILKQWHFSKVTRLLALILLTLQPFFIWYTRVAFEATVSLFFVLGVIFLLFKPPVPFKKDLVPLRWRNLLVLTFALIGSVLTYNTPLIIIPLLALILPLWHGFTPVKRWLIPAIILLLVWGILFLIMLQVSQQKSQITLFGDPTTRAAYGAYREQFGENWQKLLGNYYVYIIGQKIQNTLWQFHPGFLLKNNPGHPWHALPGTGYLTISVLLAGWGGLILAGIHFMRRVGHLCLKYRLSELNLLIVIMIIALVPAAISVNAPHATRTLLFFWVWVVFAAIFTQKTLYAIKHVSWEKVGIASNQSRFKQVMIGTLLVIILTPSVLYFHRLWVLYPTHISLQSPLMPGYEQIVQKIETDYPEDEVAVVDDRGFQYILTAWYLKMKPEEYYATVVRQQPDTINFRYGEKLGRYRFIMQPHDRTTEKVLVGWDKENKIWVISE